MIWDPANLPRGRGRIVLEMDGPVATLTLHNEAARNAMSVGMMADLLGAVETLRDAPPVAVLLTGAGDAGFCAGGDLREVRAHLMDEAAAIGMPAVMGEALDALASLPVVVVAAVEGAALGGGAELTTVADWVVAGESAEIGFVHAALGVSPGWGGGGRLLRRIGRSRATEVLLTARRYQGEAALRVGLVDAVVPDGQAVQAARDWLAKITRNPAESIRGMIEIIRSADRGPEALALAEREVFERLWASPGHFAALQSLDAGK
jgi:ethylmalonyl-CoA/methylmalonyl-CoA decarboxylase